MTPYPLASAGASLMPAASFIFDGEHTARLEKRGGPPFSCLPVHNFETFLLVPDAIAMHVNTLPGFASLEVLPGQVSEWLARNGGEGDGADGAKLLKKLFASLSESRYEYLKTRDSVALTKLVIKMAPQRFDRLVALLKPILDDARAGVAESLPARPHTECG